MSGNRGRGRRARPASEGSAGRSKRRQTTAGRRAVSRRGFMRLLAAGSAALATAPAAALAAAATTATGLKKPALKPMPARPAMGEETRREIERQKKSTLDTLKTLRDYPLPPGSDMAFVFRPLKAYRRGRTS